MCVNLQRDKTREMIQKRQWRENNNKLELFGTGEMERAHLVVWLSNHTRKPFLVYLPVVCVCVHIPSAIRVVAKWVARNSTPTHHHRSH